MYLRLKKVGRDAVTGRFVSLYEARRRPASTVIETYKIPTYNSRPAARRTRRRPHRRW